jgi:regulator of protease activity HflC (stomatin/prohibitin superfamily)
VRNRARGDEPAEGGSVVSSYRAAIFAAACVGVVLFLYFPERALVIIAGEVIFSLLLWIIAMRPVAEPLRGVVYRLAALDHVAGPGYIFLIPTLDHIEGYLDMRPKRLEVEVPQIRTADNQPVRTNLDVTWRLHPNIRGKVNSRVRATLLMRDPEREKLVEETVILMARQVVASYTLSQITPATAREAASATVAEAANEILEAQGVQIDRIFWRGSVWPHELTEAKLQTAVRLEHAESLIATVEAIKKRLPDMQPEEFLALQAWLDMFQRGEGPERPTKPEH